MSEDKPVGFCGVDSGVCDGCGSVCRLHPEFGEVMEYNASNPNEPYVVKNKSCSNFFRSAEALAKSKVSVKAVSSWVPVVHVGDDNQIEVHKAENDRVYEEYIHSLGEQVEPEVSSDFAAYKVNALSSPFLPVIHGSMTLVGHGERGSPNCGRFLGFRGCRNVAGHNKTSLAGSNFSGKVYVRKIIAHCDKPDCPICYRSGWAQQDPD